MAAGMGRVVGNIISIQESGSTPVPVFTGPGAGAASTTVLPGTLEIQATVVLEEKAEVVKNDSLSHLLNLCCAVLRIVARYSFPLVPR